MSEEYLPFNEYVDLTKRWLEQYPEDVFTGVSGEAGPLFVVAIRKAVTELETNSAPGER